MAIYAVTIDPGDDRIAAVKLLRELTGSFVTELMRRLDAGEPVITWDTEDCPMDVALSAYCAGIRQQLSELQARGYGLTFRYSPSDVDDFEDVTLEEVHNLLDSEELHDAQEHD